MNESKGSIVSALNKNFFANEIKRAMFINFLLGIISDLLENKFSLSYAHKKGNEFEEMVIMLTDEVEDYGETCQCKYPIISLKIPSTNIMNELKKELEKIGVRDVAF